MTNMNIMKSPAYHFYRPSPPVGCWNRLRKRSGLAWARLFQTNNHLILEVEDNGLGFVAPKRWMDLTEGKHYGLVGSAERAAALGGALRIHSKPGEGTLVQVSVPVLGGSGASIPWPTSPRRSRSFDRPLDRCGASRQPGCLRCTSMVYRQDP